MPSINIITVVVIFCYLLSLAASHGPPKERDQEDIAMGKKHGAKWCSMAKVCNHDRVPVCGVSHAGDIIGFRDLCDMFDFNCIRKRNYKQTSCPADRNFLTASRKPTNIYYDE
ncbi:uncharacterized protein LOC125232452 isoform X3 [Leguminivora glycinivorella]|uniref:uncharacterized protein LOC125232452 isoform X3 n=1 Tax=Leguminivora glycinivorella TaxID=1035111 RepID=UPI00200EDEF9|nr:uncharacterized protein LOC125232452 isoform X3 [Leguminivora glycinivorella]XP_047994099.1 uncharacterized protein LOC125232452 isoform X3 [Leguminivora glycinivorella]